MRAVSARNHVEVVCHLRACFRLTVIYVPELRGRNIIELFAPLNQKNVFVHKQLFLFSTTMFLRFLAANVFKCLLLLPILSSRDQFHESCLRPKHVSRSRRQSRATSASPKEFAKSSQFCWLKLPAPEDVRCLVDTPGKTWHPPSHCLKPHGV